MTTRSDALDAAAQAAADTWAELWRNVQATGTRAAAEAAHYPSHPLGSVAAIETRLLEVRARSRPAA